MSQSDKDALSLLADQVKDWRKRAQTAENERNDALRRYFELAEEAKLDVRAATEAMVCAEQERDEARREVERISAGQHRTLEQLIETQKERDEARAEVERLREALRPFAEDFTIVGVMDWVNAKKVFYGE